MDRTIFTRELKQALKNKWPKVKFSVTGGTGTAYGWIHVRDTYNVLRTEVLRDFLKPFDTQDADPLTDYAGSGWKITIY